MCVLVCVMVCWYVSVGVMFVCVGCFVIVMGLV